MWQVWGGTMLMIMKLFTVTFQLEVCYLINFQFTFVNGERIFYFTLHGSHRDPILNHLNSSQARLPTTSYYTHTSAGVFYSSPSASEDIKFENIKKFTHAPSAKWLQVMAEKSRKKRMKIFRILFN